MTETTAAPESTAPGTEAELAARLRLAVIRLSRRIRQQTVGGLTPSQVSALAGVEKLGTPTLGELAAFEQVQPPSMTRLVDGLVGQGLVSREGDSGDRRLARVALSAEGRRTLQRNRSLRNAFLVRRLLRLSPEEHERLDHLVVLLERLVDET
jgi:DNA-binding MarR family transcriptional regulator